MKLRILFALLLMLPASSGYGSLDGKKFSVAVNNASAADVIEMMAQKGGLQADITGDLTKRVTYKFEGVTLDEALRKMAADVGFSYRVEGGALKVTAKVAGGAGVGGSRSLASVGASEAKLIELKYADATEMAGKLKSLLGEGGEVHVDKTMNALVFLGDEENYAKIRAFVELFDRMPKQVLIEAKIVETNDNFARELGFQIGDLTDTAMTNTSKVTGSSSPAVSANPTFRAKYRAGVVDGRSLDVRLIAAQTKGEAKVISKPKVVTINNTRALINSGLIFNVKTLTTSATTAATTTGGTTAAPVTGGLERVEAGLQLGVLPTIMNQTMVRLVMDVNNSEPDSSISVDGIPGITNNAANTSIIVDNGDTAVIAGLIKQSRSKSRSGVPFLSEIPVLGLLFRSDGESDRNNQLMIFVTPKIMEGTVKAEGKDSDLFINNETKERANAEGDGTTI